MIVPDATPGLVAWLLVGPAAVFGFFINGYFAFRWLPSPQELATSFIGSGLLLFFAVLAGDFSGIALGREYLVLALGTAVLVGWLRSRGRPAGTSFPPTFFNDVDLRSGWREAWWLVPVSIMAIALATRWALEPLSGYDALFRWDYLSRLMASQRSLAHYPPVSAADFAVYPWCDGIPPMVPVLSAWLYLSTGSSAEIIGGVRWLVEFALTLALVWQISRRLWGANGAKVSLLVLATSALFLSSISMAQETGTSGVALLALTALLLDYREQPRAATAAWIGLAAGFAGLCRDYNLLYLPVALALLVAARGRKAHWWLAAATMAVVVAPWYLRDAWITGNPLFPHALGGLFRSNSAHQQVMREIQDYWSLFAGRWSVVDLVKAVLIGAGALLLAALPGWKLDRFARTVLAALIVTTTALWLASISSTAGGWTYSLRVLGPALPLLAIAAGGCARAVTGRWAFAGVALCALLAIDAARRSWIFVVIPDAPILPYTWQPWRNWDRYLQTQREAPLWKILSATAQADGIVVDHPNFFALGRRAGGTMVSIFSPQVAALWRHDPPLTVADLSRTLRAQGIRFVVLSGDVDRATYFYKSAPGVMRLLATRPTVVSQGLWVYDLALAAPADAPPCPPAPHAAIYPLLKTQRVALN